jgi:hypothetical protein
MMSHAIGRLAGSVATVMIALQAILILAACPQLAPVSAGFDPASYICHGGGPDGSPVPPPASNHDHCFSCVLCCAQAAAAPAMTPLETVAFVRAERIAIAAGAESPAPHRSPAQFARGPPLPV